MFDCLIELLRLQLALYDELLELSRQKKSFLLKNDLGAIQKATARENVLVGKLQKTERERETTASNLAVRLCIPSNGLTLAKLTSQIEDASIRNQLDALRARLRSAMDELKSLNAQNKALIDQHLEYIDFSMNLLYGSVSGPVYAGTEEIPGQVFFDARG